MKKMTNKMDNKGFSLVELIIVIAIMAILIGVVGSQVIPYIEKSRVSKDKNVVDTCYTAFQAAVAKEGVPVIKGTTLNNINSTQTGESLSEEVKESIGNGINSDKTLEEKFGSKAYAGGTVKFWFDPATGFIAVSVKGTGAKAQGLIISSVSSKEYIGESALSKMPDDIDGVMGAFGLTYKEKTEE